MEVSPIVGRERTMKKKEQKIDETALKEVFGFIGNFDFC